MTLKRLAESSEFLGSPDVQQTTFSLDALGRYVCNSLEEALANPYFDVIVVGSGMYGAYAATRIYEDSRRAGRSPLRVLVLEAGPFLVPEHSQNIPALGLSNPFRPPANTFGPADQFKDHLVWGTGWRANEGSPGTAYCVGGKSLYWGGWCPRLTDFDLDQWPRAVRDYLLGPPADSPAQRLRPARDVYEAMELEIGVKPTDDFIFDPVSGPAAPQRTLGLNEALRALFNDHITRTPALASLFPQATEAPPIAVQTQSFISGLFSLDKYSSLPGLIRAIRTRQGSDRAAGIFLVPYAHVSRLIRDDVFRDGASRPGYRVNRIELFERGVRRFIEVPPAGMVVLALGTIESTRLALESFPTAPSRDDRQELMGRNLMAHFRFDFPFQIQKEVLARFVGEKFGPTASLAERLQTATFHVQGFGQHGRFHFQVYSLTPPSGAGPSTSSGDPDRLLYQMIPDQDVAATLLASEDPTRLAVTLRACGEMKGSPSAVVGDSSANWVNLALDVDRDNAFDHQRAFVHYRPGLRFSAPIWSEMITAARTLAQAVGGENVPEVDDVDRHEIGTTWHDAGTLWMGEDPDSSVTDVNGRFHHVANVAVVDQSLFPTVGSANPVLTGLCLARKASEAIVNRHSDEAGPTADELAADRLAGFEFLLDPANRSRWKTNDGRTIAIFDSPGGPFLEAVGAGPLAVAFYDEQNAFSDFELHFEWKAFLQEGSLLGEPSANAGIFLRAPRPGPVLTDANFYDAATEVQIDDTGYDVGHGRFNSPLHRTGAVYGVAPAQVWAAKAPSTEGTAGFWNRMTVVAEGRRVTVDLNGQRVCDAQLPAFKLASGQLACQYHTGKVQFRNLRVHRF